MPTYFFNIVGSNSVIKDENGVELENIERARFEAVRGARGIMAEDLKAGRAVDHQRFEIYDDVGNLVYVLPFRDAMMMVTDDPKDSGTV